MSGEVLAFPASDWDSQQVDNRSAREIVLDHYDRDGAPLLRYAVFIGADAETARDVVQEAFLRLHQHVGAGGNTSNLRAWLYRVIYNLVRGNQTSAAVNKTRTLDHVNNASDQAPGPERELLHREQQQHLRVAMSRLTRAEQDCLGLRAQGLKYREISEVLGLSTSTVADTVQRALTRLRASI